ncbi:MULTISPECIES: restriction endonuclease subunit S [unclassified Sphingobacterium]|uniref:restriction endonuclease subunit S n=1 Tax=unclassified Sphingobacterium TaxID=2609468 RepID=UPI0020C1E7F2|nr:MULTISPECIES: restriction endonuclease subunit S [unclassified Sphingobacterium]
MENKKLKVGNVPHLRFPGFEGEWETKKLGEIMDFKVTNSFSRDNLNYENGFVKNIHYGDIHTKYQTLFDIANEVTPYINNEINIHRISEENYCQEGDVIFADASEDLKDVGKSIEVINLNGEKLLSGLHTLLARPQKNIFYLGFNGYLFKSNSVRTQIQKESQGTKVLSISTGRISKIKLSFPNLKEQQKIASFFSLIDQRIATQNKIIEELKLLKNTLSKKLFSGQLKFKDEFGNNFPEWESKELSEVMSVPEKIKSRNIDKSRLLTVKLHLKGVSQNDNTNTLSLGATNYFIRKKGQFIYGKQNLFNGAFGIIPDEFDGFLSSGDVPALDINHSKINTAYLLYFLGRADFYKRLEDLATGSGSKRIHETTLLGVKIDFPTIEEQHKIANFLLSIDGKIEIETNILQKLERQKTYFLANLFI